MSPTYQRPYSISGRPLSRNTILRLSIIALRKGWGKAEIDKALLGQGVGRKALAQILHYATINS